MLMCVEVGILSRKTAKHTAFNIKRLSETQVKGKSLRFDTTSPKNEMLKREFLEIDARCEARVRLPELTQEEQLIHGLHREACKAWELHYTDLLTGLQVSTRLNHFLRGKCCGSGCRHCPYEHIQAKPEIRNNKRYNSAFYVSVSPQPPLQSTSS